MGREIRRVPVGWEHPKDQRGNFVPLVDVRTGDKQAETWADYLAYFEAEWPEDFRELDVANRRGVYMPCWPADEATGWCVYENVSEGTPVSPVFPDPESLHAYIVQEMGHSPEAAMRFIQVGSAPSAMFVGGQIVMGIETMGQVR